MVIHHDSLSILKKIDKYLTLNPLSVGEPDVYLGANLRKTTIPNGIWLCIMIPSKYVQEAVRNCEIYLKEQCGGKYSLVKGAANTFAYHYEPEVDVSEPLNPEMASYYQYLIRNI